MPEDVLVDERTLIQTYLPLNLHGARLACLAQSVEHSLHVIGQVTVKGHLFPGDRMDEAKVGRMQGLSRQGLAESFENSETWWPSVNWIAE